MCSAVVPASGSGEICRTIPPLDCFSSSELPARGDQTDSPCSSAPGENLQSFGAETIQARAASAGIDSRFYSPWLTSQPSETFAASRSLGCCPDAARALDRQAERDDRHATIRLETCHAPFVHHCNLRCNSALSRCRSVSRERRSRICF